MDTAVDASNNRKIIKLLYNFWLTQSEESPYLTKEQPFLDLLNPTVQHAKRVTRSASDSLIGLQGNG